MKMRDRRAEDPLTSRMLHLRLGPAENGGGPRVMFREIHSGEGAERVVEPAEAYATLAQHQERLILLETGQPEGAWLMLGGVLGRVPATNPDDPSIPEKAEELATNWRRSTFARSRRMQLPTSLIGYTQTLVSAETPEAVWQALCDATVKVFGGHRAMLLRQDEQRRCYRLVSHSSAQGAIQIPIVVPVHPIFAEPGILMATDPRIEGSLDPMKPLFRELSPECLYHMPVGEEYVLLITERRAPRRVLFEEWQLLRLLTAQAEGALRRIELFEEVRSLSLTDDLTGLANRRHMKLVLGHAIAAARRGAPLSVLLLDIDGFRAVNDRQGHLAGDEVLCRLAKCLQTQARGSDLVVRFGGDEFVVLLPRGDRAGAEAFMRRVEGALEPGLSITWGVAEYDARRVNTPEQLLQLADLELYAAKCAKQRTREIPQPLPNGPRQRAHL